MTALLVACCLLIPAVIGVAAWIFGGREKRPLDPEGQSETLPIAIEQDLRE